MKKKFVVVITSLTLIVFMLSMFCACSSYGSVKKAFEKEGYTESESVQSYQSQIKEAIGENNEDACTVHLMVKDTLKVALILEFKSTDKMEEVIEESATLKGMIQDIQKSEIVNGNCVLFFYTPLTEALTIFKNA